MASVDRRYGSKRIDSEIKISIISTLVGLIIAASLAPQALAMSVKGVERLARECQGGMSEACTRLAELAKEREAWDWKFRAIELLTDQMVLADIAKMDVITVARANATAKLTDAAILAEIARTDKAAEVRQAALDKVTDQVVLAEVAKADCNWSLRLAAVKKLANETILGAIAKTDASGDVRNAALAKITQQSLLAEIAKNAAEAPARRAATERLSDQAALGQIAKQDGDVSVRRAAIQRLTDQAALVEVAKMDRDRNVRRAAIQRIGDQSVLAQSARTDPSPTVRAAAMELLVDEDLVRGLLANDVEAVSSLPLSSRLRLKVAAVVGGCRQAVWVGADTMSWHHVPTEIAQGVRIGGGSFFPQVAEDVAGHTLYSPRAVAAGPTTLTVGWYLEETNKVSLGDNIEVAFVAEPGRLYCIDGEVTGARTWQPTVRPLN
jgi:hypothetical protein